MYLGPDGKLTNESVVGLSRVGVPGAVAGMSAALAKYGTKSLARSACSPRSGSPTKASSSTACCSRRCAAAAAYLERFDGKTVFYPNGEPLQPGTRFRQPALARTLKLIAEQGAGRVLSRARSPTRSSRG